MATASRDVQISPSIDNRGERAIGSVGVRSSRSGRNWTNQRHLRTCDGMTAMHRRAFLAMAAAGAVPSAAPQTPEPIPIIDCHIHLFDQTRPQGAPDSGGGDILPARRRATETRLAAGSRRSDRGGGESLDRRQLVGVGSGGAGPDDDRNHRKPSARKPEFREYLDRYHKNRLFLGNATATFGATTWSSRCPTRRSSAG